jgi:hypothetical protein
MTPMRLRRYQQLCFTDIPKSAPHKYLALPANSPTITPPIESATGPHRQPCQMQSRRFASVQAFYRVPASNRKTQPTLVSECRHETTPAFLPTSGRYKPPEDRSGWRFLAHAEPNESSQRQPLEQGASVACCCTGRGIGASSATEVSRALSLLGAAFAAHQATHGAAQLMTLRTHWR